MKKLPKISININKKKEIRLFSKFLNHPDFPQHRQLILQAFSNDLKIELAENLKDEKKVLIKFINQFYEKNKNTIDLAIQDCKKEMKSSTKAIRALGKSMDYHWGNNVNYVAIPTILPFSPFSDNIFYFSILDRIKNVGKRNILTTAIHEISHFIFFDLLKEIENEKNFSLSLDVKYYAKETITTALFNEEPLKSALEIDNYLGNPDIRDIYISDKNKKPKTFIDYTRHQYIKNRNSGNKFKNFLNGFVTTINKASNQFSKKRFIWNQFGRELFKNKKALKEYRQPIKLK